MFTKKTMFIALAAAIFAFPGLALAGDATPNVSYFAKKQGRSVFQAPREASTPSAQELQSGEFDPSKIEPAAGGSEPKNPNSLNEAMKLPRKN